MKSRTVFKQYGSDCRKSLLLDVLLLYCSVVPTIVNYW